MWPCRGMSLSLLALYTFSSVTGDAIKLTSRGRPNRPHYGSCPSVVLSVGASQFIHMGY